MRNERNEKTEEKREIESRGITDDDGMERKRKRRVEPRPIVWERKRPVAVVELFQKQLLLLLLHVSSHVKFVTGHGTFERVTTRTRRTVA